MDETGTSTSMPISGKEQAVQGESVPAVDQMFGKLEGEKITVVSDPAGEFRRKVMSNVEGCVHCDVIDESSGCGAKFNVVIVSPVFEGMAPLKKHKLVNSAMKEELRNVHAFSQRTYTPEQWDKLSQDSASSKSNSAPSPAAEAKSVPTAEFSEPAAVAQ